MSTEPAAAGPEPVRGMSRLLELQELDLAIDRLQARLDALESREELQAAQSRLAELESALGGVRLAIDEVATAQRRLENDIDWMDQKIEAERKRLYDGSVVNVRELQSIEAEVKSLQGRKSRKEDELLELMERQEELDAEAAPLEVRAKRALEQVGEIEEESAREIVQVERELGERRGHRLALAEEFEPELLELYGDLRRQKRGVGAAAIVNGVCQGCHQQLSAVYLDRLKRAEGIRRCEHCRRILVFG